MNIKTERRKMFNSVFLVLLFNVFWDVTYGSTYYPCSDASYKGEPIQIVNFIFNKEKEISKFELNSTGLKSILLRPEISDKELVVLTIGGDFRKGKSFFLSLLLQYLEMDGSLEKNKLNLTHGFHWRGGSKRDTQGILMWSKPFCVKSQSGKELAILLMDTQGAFDNQQTFGSTSTIFALSFLTSSIQLYNLKEHIQENDLQNLQVFTNYGSQILNDSNVSYKPFQELVFLIRDWPNPKEIQYGAKGGQQYLNENMKEEDKPKEGKKMRHDIKSCFTNIVCFLMPHPGKAVAEGNFSQDDIEPVFIDEVKEFAAMVFNPKNLVPKQIAGKNINGKKMYEAFKIYTESFENVTIKPEPIFEATCRIKNTIAFDDSKLYYTNEMNKKCYQSFSLEPNELQQHLENIRRNTIEKFNQEKPKKCEESSKKYLDDLEKWMEEKFTNCTIQNLFKKISELKKLLKNSTEEKMQLHNSIENLNKNLTTCNKDKNDIDKNLTICNTYLSTNKTGLNECKTNLDTTAKDKRDIDKNLTICNTYLSTNKTSLNDCKTNLGTCISVRDNYKSSMDYHLEEKNFLKNHAPCKTYEDCPFYTNAANYKRHCWIFKAETNGVCGW